MIQNNCILKLSSFALSQLLFFEIIFFIWFNFFSQMFLDSLFVHEVWLTKMSQTFLFYVT